MTGGRARLFTSHCLHSALRPSFELGGRLEEPQDMKTDNLTAPAAGAPEVLDLPEDGVIAPTHWEAA